MSTLPLLLALLAAPAPGDSELASPTAPEINPLLAKVPAGTPYFIVTRERPPRPAMVALLQRHGGGWTEGMESFVLRLSALIALNRASAPESSPDGDERRERVLAVLPKSLDAPALATLGLRPDAHFAFYAKKSGVPVLRLEIAEREAFLAFLERLLAAMEWEAGRETVGDGEWLRLPFPPRQPELIAHLLVGERDVALALATPDLPAERLAELFAAPPPGGDLAASGRLETLASLHGFTGPFYGQLDFKALFSELRLVQMNEIFATCVEEFSRETEQAESLDLGMYRFDTRGLRLAIAARVHPELRQEFESEIVPLPERPESEALFELMLALRIGSGFEPPTGTPNKPAGRVYRCPLLKDLKQSRDRISSLRALLGPWDGFVIRAEGINDGTVVDEKDSIPPFLRRGRVIVLLLSREASLLLPLVGQVIPEIAELALTPGGRAKVLPRGELAELFSSVHVALGKRIIAFGINQPSGQPVEEAAARPIGKERRIVFSWELRARPQGIAEEELLAVELDKIAQLVPFEMLERERVSVELGAHGPELRIEIDYR